MGCAAVADEHADMCALDAELQAPSQPQAAAIVAPRVDGRAWLLLAALFLAYICSAIDRAVISLIVEPIKTSLHFSDTQIGLLQGVAFLLVYSLAGVPAGMSADRVPRLGLASGAVVVWSLMTSLCGLARSFSSLFAARAGVGIGESVLSPVAMSLIADRFPKSRQGLAIGIYVCGSVVGAALAIGFGGLLYAELLERGMVDVPYIGRLEPWQQTFILLGLPGLVIAPLLLLFREPARHLAVPHRAVGARQFYRRNARVIVYHHLGNGLSNVLAAAVTAWSASSLIRTYHADIKAVSISVGTALLLGGLGGMLGGGWLSDKLSHRGAHMRLCVCAGAAAIGFAASMLLPLAPGITAATVVLGMVIFCGAVPFSVANAALQVLTPANIRGTVSAIYYLSISVIGTAGPSAVAIITDHGFKDPGRLNLSLTLVMVITSLLAALMYGLAIAPYRRALQVSLSSVKG